MFLNVISWLKDYPSLLLSTFGSPGWCFLLGLGALGRSVLLASFACSLSTFSGKSFPCLALLSLLRVLLSVLRLFIRMHPCTHVCLCNCVCVFVCALNISMIHVRSRTQTQQTRCRSQRERKKARVMRVSGAVQNPHPIPDYRSPMFASLVTCM